jgi:hypothetical protein
VLEDKVFKLIREFMLDPRKLRRCFKFTALSDNNDTQKAKGELARIAVRIDEIGNQRRRMIELYASDEVARDAYINANVVLDKELDDLKRKKAEISEAQQPSGLEQLDESIRQFCEQARTRLERCKDFDGKKQFLTDHIEKIIYHRDSITLIGSVKISLEEARLTAGSALTVPHRGKN